MRIGTGYDVHKLVEGRKLIMGGVEIPYDKGLLGHSDADVLAHAIMDALLGAAALGDIGKHFPDTDVRYKGADSMMLMREVRRILEENCYLIGHTGQHTFSTAGETGKEMRLDKSFCDQKLSLRGKTVDHTWRAGRKRAYNNIF